MMLTDSFSQDSNLIRVRNNQRRSRARRREYVAELERKVHECNTQGLSACTPRIVPQDTIVRLENENRKLRELLALAGVEQDLVDRHLAAEGGVPEVADTANPLQISPETAQESLVSLENGNLSMSPFVLMLRKSATIKPTADEASVPNGSDETRAESFLQLPADDFDILFEPFQSIDSSEPSYVPQSVSESSLPFEYDASSSLQEVNPLCSAEFLLPSSSQSSAGTTLCSVAYQMVREHNQRGIDMIEIGILLWNGFVKGEGDGGCKVENELLSSVLEYIKG